MDQHGRDLGLGARLRQDFGRVCTGAGRIHRREQFQARQLQRQRGWCGLVSPGATGGLPAGLPGEPRLYRQRQPRPHDSQQYGRQQHGGQQHLQHLQQHQRDPGGICQPTGAGRRGGGACHRVRTVAASGQGGRAGRAAIGGQCGGGGGGSRGTHGDQCARRCSGGRQAASPCVRSARGGPCSTTCGPRRVRGATAAAGGQSRPAARGCGAQGTGRGSVCGSACVGGDGGGTRCSCAGRGVACACGIGCSARNRQCQDRGRASGHRPVECGGSRRAARIGCRYRCCTSAERPAPGGGGVGTRTNRQAGRPAGARCRRRPGTWAAGGVGAPPGTSRYTTGSTLIAGRCASACRG